LVAASAILFGFNGHSDLTQAHLFLRNNHVLIEILEFLLGNSGVLRRAVEGAVPPPNAPKQANQRRSVKCHLPAKRVDQNSAQWKSQGNADTVA
jgi:hypothetical protein